MRADVDAALAKFKINTFGNMKNIERVTAKLWNDEQVIYIAPTNAVIHSVNTKKTEKLPGIFVVTDKRVLFSCKAASWVSDEIFELSEIKSVESSGNGLSGGQITIHTMTKTLQILVSYKKEMMQEIQNLIYKAMHDYKNPEKTTAGTGDNIGQIEKLHDLFQQGIITQEEFEAKKKQLLGL